LPANTTVCWENKHPVSKKVAAKKSAPGCGPVCCALFLWSVQKERAVMKKTNLKQPKTFTPGVTKGMVRQHAFEMYRDKLPHHSLTLDDWVLAEKDLVQSMASDGLLKR
jgi:hypothetical protein